MGNYPDPSLPVAHQLEQALTIIRENIHLLMEAKVQHQLIGKVKQGFSRSIAIELLRLSLSLSAENDGTYGQST